ncbi:hypothetical protein FACS1894181_14370 [Bacteroidia bacterium]|nr:hypothetical protein FACS1894181_14370 [Bacteroidia bacterium]
MIIKRTTLSVLFVCLAHILHAQQRTGNIEAETAGSNIRVTCSLQTDFYVDLSLYYSEDNGLTFNKCETVSGDVENQLSGDKTLLWDCGKDGIIMGSFVFKVEMASSKSPPRDTSSTTGKLPETKPAVTKEPKQRNPSSTKGAVFLMPGVSIGKTMSYSLMAGYAGDWGGYIKAKSNFASDESTGTAGKNEVFFDSNYAAKTGRSSFSAGLLARLAPSCYLSAGVGYGTKWVQWKSISNQLVKIDELSYSGIEPEAGVIIKIQSFAISGGFSALFGKQTDVEASIGIGFTF